MNENVLHDETLVCELQKEISGYFGGVYCSLVSTGTSALEIAIRSLELPRGSKILIPDLSFIATATAVASVGMIPVYGDCSEKFYGISYEEVKKTYEEVPDIKAVIVVHFTGMVNRDIIKIADFCRKNNLFLIEDCAQVFGGSIAGKKCGTIGDLGTFSFQKSKVLTCGEGGMVLASNEKLANNVAALKDWGLDLNGVRQLHLACGNYRINQFAAAYLKACFKEIDKILQDRQGLYVKVVDILEKGGYSVCTHAEFTDAVSDVPFFVLVKSEHPNCNLHPLNEYPMHLSKLVKSIMQIQYPDLIETYQYFIERKQYRESSRLAQKTNFLPLFNRKIDEVSNKILEEL